MNGFIYYQRTLVKLMFVPLVLLYGCASAPEDMSMEMAGQLTGQLTELSNNTSDNSANESAVTAVTARKLNFMFEYKQVMLTDSQNKRLLYLYDWQNGALISYGKAKAENDYAALAIGHQRVQAVIKALVKHNKVIRISYDPALAFDSVLIEENIIQTTGVSTQEPVGLLKSARL